MRRSNHTYTAAISFLNTGYTLWKPERGYKLGPVNPQEVNLRGRTRVELDAGDAIKPQQKKTFSFQFTAPTAPGTYNFQWTMLQETFARSSSEASLPSRRSKPAKPLKTARIPIEGF